MYIRRIKSLIDLVNETLWYYNKVKASFRSTVAIKYFCYRNVRHAAPYFLTFYRKTLCKSLKERN